MLHEDFHGLALGIPMIEVGILVVIALALIGGELAVWRFVRGPSRGPFRLALRAAVVGMIVLPLVLALA
jgi:hypothetical protein